QDLFETRLIRLVRGTGLNGLPSMRTISGVKFRPLLGLWPEEMLGYAKQNDIRYLDDPSNLDFKYLRNWVRHQWLKELEQKRPGAVRAFARSLELISCSEKAADSLKDQQLRGNRALDRVKFSQMNQVEKKQLIADYLASSGAGRNYSTNKIQE